MDYEIKNHLDSLKQERNSSATPYQDEYREDNPTFGDELDIEPKTAHINKG